MAFNIDVWPMDSHRGFSLGGLYYNTSELKQSAIRVFHIYICAATAARQPRKHCRLHADNVGRAYRTNQLDAQTDNLQIDIELK